MNRASDQSAPDAAPAERPAAASISPAEVVRELRKHVLLDGLRIVVDLERSRGSELVDAVTGRRLLDLYGFYGSMPVGFNHRRFDRADVRHELLAAARTKVANSDVCSVPFAEFVRTFSRVAGLPPLERYFFIEGGAVAVENAMKAAMDWKTRKNLAAGRGARGTEILHFTNAFHGRSGYTLSVTNTDPLKVQHFAKFNWPRITAPRVDFSLPEPRRTGAAIIAELRAEAEIREAFKRRPHEIAAMLIEPIQGEGGDNHFRPEFLRLLRQICDEQEALLIFDEVQCGLGLTGKTWCCGHFGVVPDLLAFGKKVQVCGVMAGPRLDEVRDNVFRLPGRINSTWGGNLADMVRSTHCLRIIEEERLVENAAVRGEEFLLGLQAVASEFEFVSAPRGRGLMLAFDLPDRATRDAFWTGLHELGALALRSGERTLRFRPALDIRTEAVNRALVLIREQCQRTRSPARPNVTNPPLRVAAHRSEFPKAA